MSRHKDIRNLTYDDYGFSSSYDSEDYSDYGVSPSPGSPGSAMYMYRDRRGIGLSDFIEDDTQKQQTESYELPTCSVEDLSEEDRVRLGVVLEAVYDAFGYDTFMEGEIAAASVHHNFDTEQTIAFLLNPSAVEPEKVTGSGPPPGFEKPMLQTSPLSKGTSGRTSTDSRPPLVISEKKGSQVKEEEGKRGGKGIVDDGRAASSSITHKPMETTIISTGTNKPKEDIDKDSTTTTTTTTTTEIFSSPKPHSSSGGRFRRLHAGSRFSKGMGIGVGTGTSNIKNKEEEKEEEEKEEEKELYKSKENHTDISNINSEEKNNKKENNNKYKHHKIPEKGLKNDFEFNINIESKQKEKEEEERKGDVLEEQSKLYISPLALALSMGYPPSLEEQQRLQSISMHIDFSQPSSYSSLYSSSPSSSSSYFSPSLRGSLGEDVVPFTFEEPSPDDIVFSKRRQAFKQKKSKELSQFQKGNKRTKGRGTRQTTTTTATEKTTGRINGGTTTTRVGGKEATIIVAGSSAGSSATKPKEEKVEKTKDKGKDKAPKKTTSDKRKTVQQRAAAKTRTLIQKVEAYHKEKATAKTTSINLVVIGHVDAGKSTLMGHLLYLLGEVSQRTIHKHERDSEIVGKGSFSFAWVMDAHEEERLRGITMDVAVQHFTTPSGRSVTVLDAPGHRDFVPNMITGAAQADVGILVINATKGEFERGFKADGQTKEHTLLARSLGVGQLIIAVNKMDTCGWSQKRFDFIQSQLDVFLRQAGYSKRAVRYVPISGMGGENLLESKEPKLREWYSGSTLVKMIDDFEAVERETGKPFRMTVSDVYQHPMLGLAVGGKIEAGIIASRDKLIVMPIQEICQVKTLQRHSEGVEWASGGDNVDIGLHNIEANNLTIGSVLCDPMNPIPITQHFRARIIVFTIPYPLTKGYEVVLHTHSTNEPAHISKLVSLLDKSGTVTKKRPRCVTEKSTAIVDIRTNRPVCMELFSDYRSLGRFTLRDRGKTIACGIVEKLWKLKKLSEAETS